MTQTLVLYDTLSNLPGNNWSPNPAKSRFILSYKGLPFVTVWVEYSDISIAMKAIGAKPNKRSDGTDVYPVPVLSDPNTGALITDSLEIASYLEKTYPEKAIFPNNSESFIREFDSAHSRLIIPAIKSIFARSAEILSPASAKFFIGVRSIDVPLPWDATYGEDWASLEKGYNTAYEWYQKTDGKWFMGNTFSYADIIVACRLLWFKRVLKEDEWVRISSWNGGKWAQLLTDVEKECKLA
ncbi:uncharacterized protein F5891DRAFT_1040706 [Suillus fuscotomentosus]|uniref:GST N-terminal domain-containing protein n=1 Tax=Suillus fuscotomentosus TaxID=1912939 RepID=A0AAD4HJY8_9AGAM|nr:uncharacterized protein F5891DRAFT_1040706 [Suillus fuscotomentosus]KAG1898946.1 hypothetical protein F5891DRAFT_1040706 [Suillus fuscotomentosus]